ncbi:MAG: hypothetical protein IPM37_18880 [Hahellaceae bacterium]|nr:hypothetical protein [Hahellaceae bacterium]
MTLNDLLHKTCLIGLTYLNHQGDVLHTSQLAGKVIAIDAEEGITVKLAALPDATEAPPNFHLPPSLDPWFVAPKGHYKNAKFKIDIRDPDFFVTWDVVKKRDDMEAGQQEWWEWHPRVSPPRVN